MTVQIQDYTLLEFLGEGATAQVYLAQHEASGTHVAIKVIDKLLVQRSQLESKVQQEMVLHAELQHRHVLHVERVFEDARNYYMALEYCAHRSLSAIVKTLPGRQVDEQSAKKIFRQVVMGVVYLHASGVIHRDLKLANLLIDGDGVVKISDFGLAARLGEDHVTMCGTPNFIAPEVLTAQDEPYNEAVDIWSLGCILYCLLLGKAPFEGRKVSETLENVAKAGQNPLQFPEGFSSSASDLIKRLLSHNPHHRPSAQQILIHPWLRSESRKRAPPQSSGRRKSLAWMPPHPRDMSQYAESSRESLRATEFRSRKEKKYPLPSARSTVALKTRRRRTLGETHAGSQQREQHEAPHFGKRLSHLQAMSFALHITSSDSSSSLDDRSLNEDSTDLSELPLPTSKSDDGQKQGNEISREVDEAVPEIAKSFVSVIVHLELQDVAWLEIFQAGNNPSNNAKVQVQWSCKEPAEVGWPPTFLMNVSNGWEACYDPATGTLMATIGEGDSLRYEIPGVRSARTEPMAACGSSRVSPSRFAQRTLLPPLVRFCQCLALRTMQLRRIALHGEASKLPFVHYDTLPESLLASFRNRSSIINQGASGGPCLDQAQRWDDIAGIGRGCIDASGELKVVYLDGAQLTLASSGQRLWFRPSWVTKCPDKTSVNGDVFELLTTGSMSSFLPSAVKQKLESIPEFIRRLKGGG
uniref:Protein kinase domain-containing protein n=1 Tax=Hyaloperonospora arabidopsidis (strain Emoy2) TaxID=559515 RepID=M4C4D8_HYAAE